MRNRIYGFEEGLKQRKVCRTCNVEKHLSEFYESVPYTKGGRTAPRFSPYCKECSIAERGRRSVENQKDGLCACGRERVQGFSQCQSCIDVRRARHADPDKLKVIYDRNAGRRTKLRAVVLDHYGRKCACCGEMREEFLSLDHIGGWGKNHKDSAGRKIGSWRLYAWIIRNNFPDTFRILCHNCNSSHGYYGYCPHERERIVDESLFGDPFALTYQPPTSSPPLPC